MTMFNKWFNFILVKSHIAVETFFLSVFDNSQYF